MANGVIQNPRQSIGDSALDNQWTDGAATSNHLNKAYSIVNVFYRNYFTNSQHAAYGTFAKLPVGYRPAKFTYIMGMIKFTDETFYRPISVNVNTIGELSFSFSASRYVEDIWVIGSFPEA